MAWRNGEGHERVRRGNKQLIIAALVAGPVPHTPPRWIWHDALHPLVHPLHAAFNGHGAGRRRSESQCEREDGEAREGSEAAKRLIHANSMVDNGSTAAHDVLH